MPSESMRGWYQMPNGQLRYWSGYRWELSETSEPPPGNLQPKSWRWRLGVALTLWLAVTLVFSLSYEFIGKRMQWAWCMDCNIPTGVQWTDVRDAAIAALAIPLIFICADWYSRRPRSKRQR